MEDKNDNPQNIINNEGNDNIQMQNVTAKEININKTIINTDVNPEILKKRDELAGKIDEIKSSLQQVKSFSKLPEKEIDEDDFDVDWDGIMEAIETKDCVLFIGDGIYEDKEGRSVHEEFFKRISKGKIKYDEKDGFFMPNTEERVATKAKRFYNKDFFEQNHSAQTMLEKLAQLKFPLIVTISPDDTLHRIYNAFNIPHNFLFFKPKTNQSEELDEENENPVIFNLLGNAADKNGTYIYTHAQFYDYINETQNVKVPLQIEEMVETASYYLFLGIDFNKWNNRLLFFAFKFSKQPEAYALDTGKLEEIHKEFVSNQFNIGFINSNYANFADALVQKAFEWQKENPEPGVFRDLGLTFKDNTEKQLETIEDKIFKTDTLLQLSEIENYLDTLKQTITKFSDNV